MKKIINQPSEFVNEMIDGLLRAHPDQLRTVTDDCRAIIRSDAPVNKKVAIVTGGGAGHLPLFVGYVGKGLADGAAIGNVFSSPTPSQILAITNTVNGGSGVLYLYGNYQGDILNFKIAAEMANLEGIPVETVMVADDIASAPREKWKTRRGIAGLFFAYKIVGACAEAGEDFTAVKHIAEKVVMNTTSMGVALSPCVVPESGRPGFDIGEDEIEIGMGIHGERGIRREKIQSADTITESIMEKVIEDLSITKGDEVAILVNGLGGTPREELYIVFNKVAEILESNHISIHRNYVGEYSTSMEMTGMSISLLRLDAKMKEYLDAPACSPFFCQVK